MGGTEPQALGGVVKNGLEVLLVPPQSSGSGEDLQGDRGIGFFYFMRGAGCFKGPERSKLFVIEGMIPLFPFDAIEEIPSEVREGVCACGAGRLSKALGDEGATVRSGAIVFRMDRTAQIAEKGVTELSGEDVGVIRDRRVGRGDPTRIRDESPA